MKHLQTADQRLEEMILYLARDGCDARRICATLYRADFWSYCDRGASITGQVYLALRIGPGPRRFREVVRRLVATGQLRVRGGRLIALRPAKLDAFGEADLAFVDASASDPTVASVG